MNAPDDYELVTSTEESVKKMFTSTDDACFLVDGLAVICELTQNMHMPWNKASDGSNTGPCYLHLVYALERYLAMLMRLNASVKVVFFERVSVLLRQHDTNLYLAHELAIFHLSNIPALRDKVLLAACGAQEFIDSIKQERICCMLTFHFNELAMRSSALQTKLVVHLVELIRAARLIGLDVLVTKGFWYDKDLARGYIVHKILLKEDQASDTPPATTISSDTLKKKAKRPSEHLDDIFPATHFKLTRSYMYVDVLRQMNAPLELHRAFVLHLYLLESLPVRMRSSLMVAIACRNQKDSEVSASASNVLDESLRDLVDNFKRLLAAHLGFFNRNATHHAYVSLRGDSRHSHERLRRICDIFDEPLFYLCYTFVRTHCGQQVTFEQKPSDSQIHNILIRSNPFCI